MGIGNCGGGIEQARVQRGREEGKRRVGTSRRGALRDCGASVLGEPRAGVKVLLTAARERAGETTLTQQYR